MMKWVPRVLIVTIAVSGFSVVLGMALVLDTVKKDSQAAADAAIAQAERDAAHLAEILRVQKLLRTSFRDHRIATEKGIRDTLTFIRRVARRAGVDTSGLSRSRQNGNRNDDGGENGNDPPSSRPSPRPSPRPSSSPTPECVITLPVVGCVEEPDALLGKERTWTERS